MALAKKLLINDKFYNQNRKIPAPESQLGATEKIIKIIKKMQ